MSLIEILFLLFFGINILLAIPALILFIIRLVKDTVTSWQGFLVMVFSLICNQICFYLAKSYPWVLFHFKREQYSGSWAHQTKFIDVYEVPMLGLEFLGMILFFLFPLFWRLFFKKLLNTVPIKMLIILFPLYLLATAACMPDYTKVKKEKLIETKDNF